MAKNKKEMILPIGRYIDPLTDFGFKHLFGSEPSKELLVDFLNELFEGEKLLQILSKIKKNIRAQCLSAVK